MSKSPGRIVVKREIDLPRPRDLEVTYTTGLHRHRARAARAHRRASAEPARRDRGGERHEDSKRIERWAPLAAAGRACCCCGSRSARLFSVAEFIFPSPLAHRARSWSSSPAPIAEPCVADLLGHDGRLRASRIVVGVLLGFLIGSRRAWPTRRCTRCWSASTRCPRRRSCRSWSSGSASASGPAILTAFLISLLPDHGQHRHRPGDAGARARRRAARARRQALGRAASRSACRARCRYFYASLKVAITLAFVGTVRVGDDGRRTRASAT